MNTTYVKARRAARLKTIFYQSVPVGAALFITAGVVCLILWMCGVF